MKTAHPWLTPKELRGLHATHLSGAALFKRLAHPRCPKIKARKGQTGRRVLIEATPALLAFLALRRMAPGLSLEGSPVHPTQRPRAFASHFSQP